MTWTKKEVAENAARICEMMRPSGGRAWTPEQSACYNALTEAADNIRKYAVAGIPKEESGT